jgi:hypothetical protein
MLAVDIRAARGKIVASSSNMTLKEEGAKGTSEAYR